MREERARFFWPLALMCYNGPDGRGGRAKDTVKDTAGAIAMQRTIAREVEFEGVGLHSGKPTKVVLRPSRPGTGIVFVRRDLNPPQSVEAGVEFVDSGVRCTRLQRGKAQVSTPEHLLAALFALGVDNVRIEIWGGEVPILDGSAKEFAEAILSAGVKEQGALRRRIKVRHPVWASEGERHVLALPYEGLRITFAIDFGHPQVPAQVLDFMFDPQAFIKEIAPARTFGFVEEAEELWERGLALGVTPENTLVVTPEGFMTPPRFPDEPIRHKILDLIGDLALLGARIEAHIIAIKSGHSLNQKLLRQIKKEFPPEPTDE
ncbi:MAG TPA: UDP-3-O-[3-hydroxymyristoyl] N-acetylglucosamine deacetylase [Armatimonadetes bacterium]|nr:UDP-3-O-[3-hydroxymyristoyl] N-acetylglucosamine deacetylase [Armatimonadota bacterium]